MDFSAGAILEGTVKTITKFGAFIQLPDNKVGMAHISEISYTFVSDIHDVLQEGQPVRVKVLGTDERGKIALSVKKAQERRPAVQTAPSYQPPAKPAPQTFEEKLKQFMSDSDSKISACRQYEHRTKSRKR